MEVIKSGPVAPKDPEKSRSCFFIMRGTEITGSSQPDGKGIQFLYEDCGRLACSAKLVGNITDQKMLDMLSTTKDFRKLVHSIGVSIEADDPSEEIQFVFQMYGKSDPYHSGTNIMMKVQANGAEEKIALDQVTWSEDDDITGQIRFEFEKANTFATASICFYLNDGYDAPAPEEERTIDFKCAEYYAMLEKSLIQTGNVYRLKQAIDKARAGKDVTVAYIGGSITQGAGAVPINTKCYAYQSFMSFCKVVDGTQRDNIYYVKAGVGGTPSEFGLLRYEQDVLRNGSVTPDVVIVEFAVNDEGDETQGECYDSLVRMIYQGPGSPAVILLFSVFANDWNLEERLSLVGRAYQLPMVSVKQAVVEQFYKKDGQGRVLSKRHFFFDLYHPTNVGHKIMADCLEYLFEKADQSAYPKEIVDLESIKAPIGDAFTRVLFLDRIEAEKSANIQSGGFDKIDEDVQVAEKDLDLEPTPEYRKNWRHTKDSSKDPYVMDIECTALILVFKDSASVQEGIAEIYVDGEKVLSANPRVVGWTHYNSVICFRDRERKNYHIEVKMQPGDENKEFTIFGWGYVR